MSAQAWEAYYKDVLLYLPRLPAALAIFVGFWVCGHFARRFIVRVAAARKTDRNLVSLLSRTAWLILFGFGTITALGTAGIDVSSLVAGLGLTGFALGFALKDIISNALSGVLIIVYKPFIADDHITMPPYEGSVLEVNLRYTVLDGGEKRVFIPNSLLFTNPIIVQTQPAPLASAPVRDSVAAEGAPAPALARDGR